MRKLLVLVFEQTIEQAFLLFFFGGVSFRTQINDFDGFGIFRLLGIALNKRRRVFGGSLFRR